MVNTNHPNVFFRWWPEIFANNFVPINIPKIEPKENRISKLQSTIIDE